MEHELKQMLQEVLDNQKRFGERFDQLDNRLDQVEQRLDKVEQRLDQVEQRMARIENEMNNLHRSFDILVLEQFDQKKRMYFMNYKQELDVFNPPGSASEK